MTTRDTFGSAEDRVMAPAVTGGDNSHSLSGDLTPFEVPPGGLAAATLTSLRDTLRGFGQEPTAEMWKGLAAVAGVLEAMANGTCTPSVYVSSLDPGVGKTQLIVHFLRELLRSPQHGDVSAIICVNRKEQIRAISAEAALDQFAVLTADPDLNGIATAPPNEARVLFTTQQMVEARCRLSGSFEVVSAFHYDGRPREVRIWDESMLPGHPLMVSFDDLHVLKAELRNPHREFAAALDAMIKMIELADDGERLELPNLSRQHDIGERAALKVTGGRAAKAVGMLWPLFGHTVTVRRGYGDHILDYRDSIPPDLKPVLVLDASARVRTTYDLWSKHRGGQVRLPSATKDYARLTIGVLNRGGGKDAFRYDAATMAEGVARTIGSRANEEWLVVHHKPTIFYDFERLVRDHLPANASNVHYLTWGRHDATNAFAHVPNVILAGTLFKPEAHYEAVGRAASGHPSSAGSYAEVDPVKRGENAHGILQAMCRGSVRQLKNGSCAISRAFIIAHKGSGIPRLLPELFPGASIEDWQPIPKQLVGHQERAFDYIVDRIEADPSSIVPISDVYRHIGVTKENFKSIRKHKAVRAALEGRGIQETVDTDGHPPGYWHQFRYYFGDDDD